MAARRARPVAGKRKAPTWHLSQRNDPRDATQAKALGPDLDRVAGSSLDKGAELDALAAIPAEARSNYPTSRLGRRGKRDPIGSKYAFEDCQCNG